MSFKKNKSLLFSGAISSLLFLSGCAHLDEHKKMTDESKKVSSLKMIDEIASSFKSENKGVVDRYQKFHLILDDKDLFDIPNPDLKITAQIDSSLKDALDFVFSQMKGVNVAYRIEAPESLSKEIKMTVKDMPIKTLLKSLEDIGGIDLYFKNNVLYVSDYMIVKGVLAKYEGDSSKQYDQIKEYLKNRLVFEKPILKPGLELVREAPVNTTTSFKMPKTNLNPGEGNANEGSEAENSVSSKPAATEGHYKTKERELKGPASVRPSIIIDPSTGAISIKASPYKLRENASLIEDYLNSSISHASVELKIFKIDNSQARSMGISATKIIDNLYTLSFGSQANTIANATLSFDRNVTDKNGDILKMGLNLYEKTGLITSESSTVLTVFNNVPTKLSDIQNVGYWIPGEIKQNNVVVNGANTVSYSEGKPEFVKEDVGKKIIFTPRVDLNDKIINMSISFSDSRIYSTQTFSWNRNPETNDVVELQKPLKSENKIEALITLNKNHYSIFAGFKSKEGSLERTGVPGVGNIPLLSDVGNNTTKGKKSSLFFVMRAIFPKKRDDRFIVKIK